MKRFIALVLVLTLVLPALTSCGERVGTGACEYFESRDITDREVYYVEICVKNYGKIWLLLDATTAPITVANFVSLAREGFYDGLTFHRVIRDFMIQGGDPKGNGTGGADKDIVGEFVSNGYYNDISHLRGVISMAREGGNPNSASSQFFICNADAMGSLDGDYAAFGYVIAGMSVVDEITAKVFPKTAYAEYYGTMYHQFWQQYGNGTVTKKADKPVIKYIKVLSGSPI